MSIDPVNDQASATSSQLPGSDTPLGNLLPDLDYVSQLFAAIAGTDSANALAADSNADAPIKSATDNIAAATINTPAHENSSMSNPHAAPLALPTQCLLRDASEIRAALLDRINDDELLIDVAQVERVDAAFMQVLLALVRQRNVQSKSPPKWVGDSVTLNEAASVLGLSDSLHLTRALVAA